MCIFLNCDQLKFIQTFEWSQVNRLKTSKHYDYLPPPPFFKRQCSSDENLNKSGTKDLKCSNVCLFLELKIMNVKIF